MWKSMDDDVKVLIKIVAAVVVVVLIGVFISIGPKGLANGCNSWSASAYGSDWLVVQYAQSGCVITTWELSDAAVHNEGNSDGIYFQHAGSTVHLSGHYVYVENAPAGVAETLTATGKCVEETR